MIMIILYFILNIAIAYLYCQEEPEDLPRIIILLFLGLPIATIGCCILIVKELKEGNW